MPKDLESQVEKHVYKKGVPEDAKSVLWHAVFFIICFDPVFVLDIPSSPGNYQAGVSSLPHKALPFRRVLLRPPPLRCLWLDGSIIISGEGHRTLKVPPSFWTHSVIARPYGVMAHRSCMLTVLADLPEKVPNWLYIHFSRCIEGGFYPFTL